MHRIFKTRHFHRWMSKTDLSDQSLCYAISEMIEGLVDAHLGGSIVKKRVAGRGKSSGARTIVATNFGNHWFFLYGFEKNVRANITDNELDALKEIATDLLALNDDALTYAVAQGKLLEIYYDH
ncbi:type II toxin-antitoxin system RelE/ParE family toxin [Methylotenera sp. L2L1]|jgi:hypothetical protein|uniref:type II toxin-antitoxin system RelE/ParE family toxin n=1 Tax=Methylotenera sp. L2L1 TaxID=1502770 RepID=UPI00056915D7|nr:type II toxin-antitoxin system RelE/ParE family toxin [Methylotenera sp. L2L1]MDD2833719.1 type II toxin-antitoxin system RelE/ParE family toxin [Methylotenera sp.]HOY86703.1 type II toxin-antitoxin system RelE/ParE family toxin [Methylotenera sp.]HPM49690.1 type II toxin-antitoxin system RelE/ParE family toxin [Methylotenera sp.]